jgi:hypothetical protein
MAETATTLAELLRARGFGQAFVGSVVRIDRGLSRGSGSTKRREDGPHRTGGTPASRRCGRARRARWLVGWSDRHSDVGAPRGAHRHDPRTIRDDLRPQPAVGEIACAERADRSPDQALRRRSTGRSSSSRAITAVARQAASATAGSSSTRTSFVAASSAHRDRSAPGG